jgi:ComF family protein
MLLHNSTWMNKLKLLIDLILNLILPKDHETNGIENMPEIEILNTIPPALEIKDNKYKALFQHKNRLSRKAIWAIKYRKNQKILTKFSNLLYEYMIENISDEITFSGFDNPILLPIPMHKNDLKERGYNQSELIVKKIFEMDEGKNFDILLDALIKVRQTPHQSALKNKSDRLKNLKNCFYAEPLKVKNKNIILIDDVITTGTTMNGAAKTLKNAGAKKVIGFSLTH